MTKKHKIGQRMSLIIISLLIVFVAEALALIILKTQVSRYRDFWEKNNSSEINTDALVYVALGDSTAQGIGATSPMRSYVGLVARSLESKHKKPVHIVNLSKTGAKLSDCIEQQLPRLQEYKPDFITIEIGANDMARYDSVKFRTEMEIIIEQLPDRTVISNIPYFGGGRHRALEKNAKDANMIIKELTNKHNLRLAPLYTTTKDRDSILTYAADFFHPSNIGYKNWHDAFWVHLGSE